MITIGQTSTSSKEVISKLNTAIRDLPDCSQPTDAAWYEKQISLLTENLATKAETIENYLEDIKKLNERIERLRR